MKIALGQIDVAPNWQKNAETCVALVADALAAGAEMLVLPEGILARDIADPELVLKSAQGLDGPFMQRMLSASAGNALTIVFTIHVPRPSGKVRNVLVVLRNGEVLVRYEKLHLYDAFAMRESDMVEPGDALPPLVEAGGLKFGLMTCYDLRFPELARRLAVDGADAILVPAAWVRGPGKEAHWEVLSIARALENTCYLVAVGECGARNIGASMVVDPLGVAVARAGSAPCLLFADLDPARIAHAREVLPVLANRRFARPELAGPTTTEEDQQDPNKE